MTSRKPIVHLFETPRQKYLYDDNKNEIVAINDALYFSLSKLLKNENFKISTNLQNEINELKERGYCLPSGVDRIEHPLSKYLTQILDRNVEKITLQLTQDCNLRCHYCPYTAENSKNRGHQKKFMTEDIALHSLIFLRDHSIDCESVCVGFYGGEPLLNFDQLRKFTNMAKDILFGKNLTFSITTNGTVFSDEIIKFFCENDFSILISLDGNEQIHNKHRVFENGSGSFNKVITNLQYINQHYSKLLEKISFNSVLDPANDYTDFSDLFEQHPFLSKCRFSSTIMDDFFSNKENTYSENFISKKEYNDFLANLSIIDHFNKSDLSENSKSYLSKMSDDLNKWVSINNLPAVAAPGGPCVPGQLRLMVTTDGEFYTCERVSETSKCMNIGNVYSGFDFEKIYSQLNIGALTQEECLNCWAFMHCGCCAKHGDNGDTLSAKNKLNYCNSFKASAHFKLLLKAFVDESKTIYK